MKPALELHHDAGVLGCVATGDRLISWSTDRTVRLWELPGGQASQRLEYAAMEVLPVVGRVIIHTQDELLAWDLDRGTTCALPDSAGLAGFTMLPGDRALCWDHDGCAREWAYVEDRSWCWQLALGVTEDAGCAFGPQRIATVDGHCLSVWERGRLVEELTGHDEPIIGVQPLPGGRLLSWGWDRVARIWQADGAVKLVKHPSDLGRPIVHADGFVTWSYDGTVQGFTDPAGTSWQLAAHAPLLAVHSAGDWLVALQRQGRGQVWRQGATAPSCTPGSPITSRRRPLAGLCQAGSLLASWATGSPQLILWDPETGTPNMRLQHDSGVVGASPSSRGLLSWTEAGAIRLWTF